MPSLQIRDVRCMLLTAPVPLEHQFTSDLGTVVAFHAAIVVIETDSGIVGYGEAKGSPVVMRAIVEHELRPLLIGQDPTRVQYIWEQMYNGTRVTQALHYGRSQTVNTANGERMCAISGVDIALWDIAGKALNAPICKLLGGPVREKIRAYASGGHGSVETIGEQVSAYVSKGFKAFKMRVGGMDHPRMIDGSVERVRAAREAVGRDVEIMLDAHGSTGVREAKEISALLENHNIAWFEEPVIHHDFERMAEVRRHTRIPIATGENLFSRFSFRDLAHARAADVWQPDLAMAGGITEVVRIAGLASALDVRLAPHVWGSAILAAASLQFAGAMPNYSIFEFGQTYNPLLFELTDLSLEVDQDGYVAIPLRPGLGFELRPDVMERFPFNAALRERKPMKTAAGTA